MRRSQLVGSWWLFAGALSWSGLVLSVLAVSATADEPPDGVRVARLIRNLGSESYPERTEAHAALAALGALPREQLLAALDSPEPEVRLRARELLKRLKADELWSASRVTIEQTEAKASEMLAVMAAQTGNRIVLGDQYASFHEESVSVPSGEHSFWPLLDDICAQSGNRVRPHYDARQPGLVALAGKRAKYPIAYSGPIRGTVTGARREFKEELDYEQLDSDVTHAFQLTVQFAWEERFRLVAYRSAPELLQARTDTGQELVAVQTSSPTWNVAGGSTRMVSMNLRLQPPAVTMKRLDKLQLRWGLIAVGDIAALEVADLTAKKSYYQDDVQLVVDGCQLLEGGRCEVALTVIRDMLSTEPQDVFFQEHDVVLLDGQGKEYRQQSQTHSTGDGGAKLKLTFASDTADSEPKKLVFRYPRVRAKRDIELNFRDVPLPVGKPE